MGAFKEFSQKCPKQWKNGGNEGCETIWNSARDHGPGISTLHAMARKDNPKKYSQLINESISGLYEQAERGNGTEWDIAEVVFGKYKHCFRCSSIKDKTWFE